MKKKIPVLTQFPAEPSCPFNHEKKSDLVGFEELSMESELPPLSNLSREKKSKRQKKNSMIKPIEQNIHNFLNFFCSYYFATSQY